MSAPLNNSRTMVLGGFMYFLLLAGAYNEGGIIDRDSDNKCKGSERWAQKVLIDDYAGDVNYRPITTTIEELAFINTHDLEIKRNTERQDIEMQTYIVKNVFISHAVLENDNDIHLVLEDGDGNHMVAEIPDPDCAETEDSEKAGHFRNARETFLRYQHNYMRYRFNITGVLFVDKKHARSPTGNNDNNVELHPVLRITPVSGPHYDS